jgi:hypothetical protein
MLKNQLTLADRDDRPSVEVRDWQGDASGRSEEDVERAIGHLKRICRNASLEYALQVGRVIVHFFYNGDTARWRARGPKTNSFRRLAAHPELPMSPGALYRCVALFELCDRLDAPSRWRNLSASHLRAVLSLPPELQERTLCLANSSQWTVKALDAEVRRHGNLDRSRGGRKSAPPLIAGLKTLDRCVQKCNSLVEELSDADAQELRRSAASVAVCQESLGRLAYLISTRIRNSTMPSMDGELAEEECGRARRAL